jgi:phenylpropionate dioxygenase-like ring-hydroxylating dioxygenase large terminal subunit
VHEKYGWIWVWMGEEAAADTALIPDFHPLTDPQHASVGKTNHARSNYTLVTDNLMDLSHVGFVHTSTIGNTDMGEKGKLSLNKSDKGVQMPPGP